MPTSLPGLAIFKSEIDKPSAFLPCAVSLTDATSNAGCEAASP